PALFPVPSPLRIALADFVELTKLRTPLAADVKVAADIGAKLVMTTSVFDRIEPRAGAIDCSAACYVSGLRLGGRGKKALIISLRVGAFDRMWHSIFPFQKKRWMANAM